MLTNLRDVALTVIAGTALILVTNFFTHVLTDPRGVVTLGAPVLIRDTPFVPIIIQNYSSNPIDGLRLSLPVDVPFDSLTSSAPLLAASVEGTTQSRTQLINLSSIPPRWETVLLVPGEVNCCSVINAAEKGLTLRGSGPLRNRWVTASFRALRDAAIYAAVVLLFTLWFAREQKRLHVRIDEARAEAAKNQQRLDELQVKFEETRRASRGGFARMRRFLVRRISDQARELAFWRDAIRSYFVHQAGSAQSGEELIQSVTDRLKTYTTRQFPPRVVDQLGAWDDYIDGSPDVPYPELTGIKRAEEEA